ncbi:MAG: histone deacetylase family protein [Kordiimonadaceae bacterium]|nr:histone deacetylase family protein [Kordiimonadaceae bacterium]MBO6570212.1 histone deacetylase family protein [Kordiimonadaceae bacterium]MBO6965690.1 histone deacetylase family protein [Kordiimonadaceae bacterium]
MLIFYADKHAAHDCAGEIKDGELKPCFENPTRADAIAAAFKSAGFTNIQVPADHGKMTITAVHDEQYVAFLETAWNDWTAAGRSGDIVPLVWPGKGMRVDVAPQTIDGKLGLYCFDSGTPICPGTWEVAYQGAQSAISTAKAVWNGPEQHAFSFSRPPGHHAMPSQYGGYCFLNNAAIAAQTLRDEGAARVAVLDVDYHHGNGTQAIFYERNDVMVVNIHSDPTSEYPYYLGHAEEIGDGVGSGYNLNLPLPKGTSWQTYLPTLEQAIQKLIAYAPEALVLSFGADTFKEDPLGFFELETEHYVEIGKRVAAINLPTAIILEGGYAIDELGTNVVALLSGFASN